MERLTQVEEAITGVQEGTMMDRLTVLEEAASQCRWGHDQAPVVEALQGLQTAILRHARDASMGDEVGTYAGNATAAMSEHDDAVLPAAIGSGIESLSVAASVMGDALTQSFLDFGAYTSMF